MAGTSAPPIPDCRDLTPVGQRLASTLYAATSDRLGREVTVVVYPAIDDAADRRRFDEAAATAQWLAGHPNVLAVHDWGHGPDGRPWAVTDPQPTDTVDTVLRSHGPLPVERALEIGVLVAGALETAHRAGIVHGDLSPARLVFGAQGEPLVADVGLAEFSAFPGFGALFNPVRYHAPPEVLERTGVSPASDVYSLASTVYALLAARAPHEKPADVTDSNASLLLRVLQIEPPPIVRADLPSGLEDALHAALGAGQGKRPQQAVTLAWSLQDVQRNAGLPVTEPVVLDVNDRSGALSAPPPPSPTPAATPARLTVGADDEPVDPPITEVLPATPASPATPAARATEHTDGGPAPLPAWYTDSLPSGQASGRLTEPDGDLVYLFSDTPPDLARRTLASEVHWPATDPDDEPEASLAGGVPTGPAAWPGVTSGVGPEAGGPRLNGTSRNGHHLGAAPAGPSPVAPPPVGPPALGDDGGVGATEAVPTALHDANPSQRLPRRHEVEGQRPPLAPAEARPRDVGGSVATGSVRPGSALDRARQARSSSRRSELVGIADDPVPPPAPDRTTARRAGPSTGGAAASGGAPAVPVIVLVVLVIALTLGVAYMVISGDGGSATDGDALSVDDDGAAASVLPPGSPANLVAETIDDGVRLRWDGVVGTSYVVRVLTAEAPRDLPPTAATTVELPATELPSDGAACFDVATVSDPEATSPPACVGGATSQTVRTS